MNELFIAHSFSRRPPPSPPLYIARDVSQDHFPTFSLIFFIRFASLFRFGYFSVFTWFFFSRLPSLVLADALTKDLRSTRQRNSLWFTLSTQLIKPNNLEVPPPLPSSSPRKRRRTTVCLDQFNLFSLLQIQITFDLPAPNYYKLNSVMSFQWRAQVSF